MAEDYLEEVKKIIAKQFGIEEEMIEEDSNLDEDLNITDLDMEDLITVIEDKYQIQIPQEKFSKFEKVSDMVNYLYENTDQL